MRRSSQKIGAVGSSTTLLGGAGSALLLALAASPAGAVTTFTVDTLDDGVATASDCTTPVAGSCSLRDALAAAAVGDSVVFSPTLFAGGPGTITLTAGQLEDLGVDILGPGADLLTIDADGAGRVVLLESTVTGTTISGVTLTGGYLSGEAGSAILDASYGNLLLTDVVVEGNTGTASGAVAAVNLTMTDSVVADNTGDVGGGIFAVRAISIIRSTVRDNFASERGGGIGLNAGSTGSSVSIIDSTISGNTSSGQAGGLFVYAPEGSLLIANSTVSGNTALYGGAVTVDAATIRIVMSTVSHNAGTGGELGTGGLLIGSDMTSPSIDLTGSIVAGNTAAGLAPSDLKVVGDLPVGSIEAASALIGIGTPAGVSFVGEGLVRTDAPMLGPLADNGGPTKTMLPQGDSPAIGAGPMVIPTFPGNEFDQRGTGFPRRLGARSTIGAVEVAPVVPSFTG